MNSARKIISLITLKRIERQVDEYTGTSQHAYKNGVGCSEIVWTQRIFASVVKKKQIQIYKMGIDMSRAFDTIDRDVLVNLLFDSGCSNDDVRLVKMLLSNTQLRVKLKS